MLILDLPEQARVDVVDKAAHPVAMGKELRVADACDRLAHVGVDVGEGLDCEGGATPVASWSSARKPSSVIFSMPQSVWWISIDPVGAEAAARSRAS